MQDRAVVFAARLKPVCHRNRRTAKFDDRGKKISQAMARVLQRAGVNFAILGPEEACNGDMARRAGNEYLAQMLMQQNAEVFNQYKPKKILTGCPHCYNTLKYEYPQFGGEYETIHHSELLMRLVDEGKITPDSNGQTVTFHDPCYLGRYNDGYTPPRDVIDSAGERVEMARSTTDAFCCGAGGGKMWFDEDTGKKVNIERTQEAVACGTDVVATGCPFCFVMIDDGVRDLGVEETVVVKDIAMLLEESVRSQG